MATANLLRHLLSERVHFTRSFDPAFRPVNTATIETAGLWTVLLITGLKAGANEIASRVDHCRIDEGDYGTCSKCGEIS